MKHYKPAVLAALALALAFCGCDKETITVYEYEYDVPTATVDGSAPERAYVNNWEMPDEMPILAWRGIPSDFSTVEQYTLMKECGINLNYAIYRSESQLEEALNAAEQAGVGLFPSWDSGLVTNAEKYVPVYDSHPAMAGYFLGDEPTVPKLPTIYDKMHTIMDAGATKPCYVNLVGYSTNHWYTIDNGVSGPYEYLQTCIDYLDPPFISFDLYPIRELDDGQIVVKPRWYECLEMIREFSIKTGKPFWAFALTTRHSTTTNTYPLPTLGHIRLQVNMDLAYGAQGLEYFTYWAIDDQSTTETYYEAPIDENGNPTETYYKLQQVNNEVLEVAPLFYKGEITKVLHFTDEFEGVNIVSSSAGAVGSLLTSPAGDEYVVVVNKSFDDNMTITYRGETYELEEGAMKVLPR